LNGVSINDSRAINATSATNGHDPLNGSITEDGSLSGSITDTEMVILELLRRDPHLTRRALTERASKSERTVQRMIKTLKDRKLIERAGSKKSGYWVVAEDE
jgi:ATP-dependent DNA helicase RecG